MSITNKLNQIKNAIYGKEVRGAIHDAIKECYDDASVNHDNANMEVKMARGTHNTLNDRLDNVDEIQAQTNAQLSTKIKELDDKTLCYVTRGDNNTSEDPSCVASKNVIGIVKAVIPGLGRIQFFLASKFGWLCLIVIPAVYIIIKDLFKLFKYSRKNKKDDYTISEKDNINEAFKNNKYNKKNKSKFKEIIHEDDLPDIVNESAQKSDEKEITEEVQMPIVSKSTNDFDDIEFDLPKLKDE